MDINDFRSLITVLGLACFVAICVWAYSKSARAGFEEAARLPFTDDDAPSLAAGRHTKEG
ncbi:CcoQ/FixQ family Cbb3-type cytochrome c oxidase assembly chaperone [Aromatoleum toluclasticum]|uniref:CcoQ/FixQ family Cbb3-type cytochrome c oxidase assembly chaperone n=1 Tax=Aromatoleum toluclasticum TaxID=92003 RepID=UPI000361B450|nr:CcoQ/FixQ family Cbb3-type cytochrome c oxidase assembly chaperone [Aromatoleum toluclasticum]MCC4116810.1 CcoQ/FixQ family Cbb3-type cytochrome c oxidase assembly chaperone [Aromatoleum toluclasticum]